jgi:phospholipid/cholesterol/gamma-HCH transport system substrate-binding protein
VPGDGSAHFGLAVNLNDPPACEKGYESTKKRSPEDGTSTPANLNAGCTEPKGNATDVRGTQNAPVVGGPEPLAVIPQYSREHAKYPTDSAAVVPTVPGLGGGH